MRSLLRVHSSSPLSLTTPSSVSAASATTGQTRRGQQMRRRGRMTVDVGRGRDTDKEWRRETDGRRRTKADEETHEEWWTEMKTNGCMELGGPMNIDRHGHRRRQKETDGQTEADKGRRRDTQRKPLSRSSVHLIGGITSSNSARVPCQCGW